jgi:hypothetical protein
MYKNFLESEGFEPELLSMATCQAQDWSCEPCIDFSRYLGEGWGRGWGRGWEGEGVGEIGGGGGGGGQEDEKLGLQASLKSAYLIASSFFAIIFANFFLQTFRASTPTTDRHL